MHNIEVKSNVFWTLKFKENFPNESHAINSSNKKY